VTNGANDSPATRSPAASPLPPGEALAKLFLDNADKGCNAENDTFVAELLKRMRALQALAPTPANENPRRTPTRSARRTRVRAAAVRLS
jgi:hypothetical protein